MTGPRKMAVTKRQERRIDRLLERAVMFGSPEVVSELRNDYPLIEAWRDGLLDPDLDLTLSGQAKLRADVERAIEWLERQVRP